MYLRVIWDFLFISIRGHKPSPTRSVKSHRSYTYQANDKEPCI